MISVPVSFWLILLCLALGIAYAFILYRKSKFYSNQKFFSFPNILLSLFRFIAVAGISFFLLSPFLKKNFKHIEEPLIVIAADNSKSILINKDSLSLKKNLNDMINVLGKDLNKKYKVDYFLFGKNVIKDQKLDFEDERTNFSKLINYVHDQYYNHNLAAVILLSDGNYNEGEDPVYQLKDFQNPFYTIALGDTTTPNDLLIENISYNSIAYLDNQIPLRINIKAQKLKGKTAAIVVKTANQTIVKQNFNILSNNFDQTFEVFFEARKVGIEKISIQLNYFKEEISYANNHKDIFIEVLENKKKIVIVANSPHPDVFALKNVLEKSENYSISTFLASDFETNPSLIKEQIQNADLIILHQLPSDQHAIKPVLAQIDLSKTPTLFILGAQTSLTAFNSLKLGLQVIQSKKNFESALAVVSPSFNYFNLPENIVSVISELPPLSVPFGNYKTSVENQVLLYQKIGKVNTNFPLFIFLQGLNSRVAVLCGEGIWRWPLTEFRLFNQQTVVESVLSKTVQYLSVKEDKRLFRLKNFSNSFYEDEQITFEAELFNQSFEPFKGAEIKLVVKNSESKNYEYSFSESGETYTANAGFLPSGKYFFEASTIINGKKQELKGEFVVKKLDVEYQSTVADHNLLFSMAEKTGGKMYYPDQMKELSTFLLKSNDLKPVIYFNSETKDLIEIKWLFFFILLLLTTEWFLRKFFGSY